MITHRFTPEKYFNVFGTIKPALRISPGDRVITTTLDAHGYDQDMKKPGASGNPLTGPFFVEGSGPGDTLIVHIETASPNRDTGWTSSVIADHLVDHSFVRELPQKDYLDWKIDRKKSQASYVDPETGKTVITLPLSPMLGCIGVAPSEGQMISSRYSGEHGGNMDYRGFREGTTAFFPVFQEGALLYVGDGHAAQGDGEPVGTGIETSFDVQFSVDLVKGKRIQWPRGEDSEHIFTAGNAAPLEQAARFALTEMIRWLGTDYNMTIELASIILGQATEFDLANLFNPLFTAVCRLRKTVITNRGNPRE